ncbi:dihydrofolate reductase family protein [Georgenia sp. MJ173]|uniref:dihydrofolate reductase family protein n=1 Tax=Georgenia sunbinii TaxID=3117728 RepID=UPI002F25F72B
MATLLYSATMSVDGFIAGPGSDMSWLAEHAGPAPVADALVTEVGALLVGRRTYDGDDPNRGDPEKEGAFAGQWDGRQVVLTHRLPGTDVPGVTFNDDLRAAVALASAAADAAGGKYVNVLGADVARQCLAAGLLDEVLVFTVPVLLGDGVRLYSQPGGTRTRLERIATVAPPDAMTAWYRVLR